MTLVEKIKARARANLQRIVLPEGEDPRIVSAAAAIARDGFAKVTLLGRKQIIGSVAAELHVGLGDVAIADPAASPRAEEYAQIYYERRRARGVSLEEAREIARRPLYFAALSVAAGDADGSVEARRRRRAKPSARRCTRSASRRMRSWFPVFSS